MESNIALCGMGGLQSNTLTYKSGTSGFCTCGDTATAVAPAGVPSQCVTSTSPGSLCDPALPCNAGVAGSSPKPTPDVKVPTPVDWLELEGFQDPGNPKGLGENGVCEFYFRSDNVTRTWTSHPTVDTNVVNDVKATFMSGTTDAGEIFVWDHTDDDAQGCKTNNSLATCPAPASNIVTHNCQTGAGTTYQVAEKDIVKRPCAWVGGDATTGPRVVCADDKTTPCWKLVARTRNSTTAADTVVQQDFSTDAPNAVQQDFSTGAPNAVWSTMTNPPPTALEAKEETRNASWAQVFSPFANQRVPNIEKYWGDPAAVGAPLVSGTNNGTVAYDQTAAPIADFWNDFCRPTTACTGCSVGETLGMQSNNHWHFEKAPMCREDFFSPSILVFENQALSLTDTSSKLGRFHVKEDWGSSACASGPVQHTVIVQGHAELAKNTRICGAFSDCTGFPADGAACDTGKRGNAKGYVLRAGGSCYIGEGTTFVGDFACGNIHINANPAGACSIGNLVAFNDDSVRLPGSEVVCPDASATSGFQPCTKGICIKDSFNMMGDIISDADICIRSGVTIFGSVLGGGDGPNQGNIFIENNTTINGQLVSEGHIGMRANVVINNNGTGIFGSRVTSGIRIESSY